MPEVLVFLSKEEADKYGSSYALAFGMHGETFQVKSVVDLGPETYPSVWDIQAIVVSANRLPELLRELERSPELDFSKMPTAIVTTSSVDNVSHNTKSRLDVRCTLNPKQQSHITAIGDVLKTLLGPSGQPRAAALPKPALGAA